MFKLNLLRSTTIQTNKFRACLTTGTILKSLDQSVLTILNNFRPYFDLQGSFEVKKRLNSVNLKLTNEINIAFCSILYIIKSTNILSVSSIYFAETFYFRWLENIVIDIASSTLISMVFNHLNWSSSKLSQGDFVVMCLNIGNFAEIFSVTLMLMTS